MVLELILPPNVCFAFFTPDRKAFLPASFTRDFTDFLKFLPVAISLSNPTPDDITSFPIVFAASLTSGVADRTTEL